MYSGLLADYHAVRDERDAALAEVTRLREALDEIANRYSTGEWRELAKRYESVAIAALAEGSDVLPEVQ